jgi:dTDP-4-amino-4,6-dideoxygalactose transaminase
MSDSTRRAAPEIVAKQRIMPLSYGRVIGGGSKKDEARFLTRIGARFGPDTHAIPIGRARMGIHLLAKLSVKGERRRVLMSPFTIPDVVTMVVLAGAEPVFYDFEPGSTAASLESLGRLVDERTAAVIVTHYHVNEVRLPEIAALCRKHGAYLFDDCAISFGGEINGKPIGTLTDASVFSFSSFKLMNYFWGGLITTRDASLAHRLNEIAGAWPRLTPQQYRGAAQACLRYDLASSPLLFKALVFPIIRARIRKSAASKGLEPIRIETGEIDKTLTSRPSLAAFAEWTPKLDKAGAWLDQRRGIAAIYRRQLAQHMVGAATPERIIAGSCFTNFPVLVPEARCAGIARSMMLAGFDIGRALYPNAHCHPKFTGIAGETGNVDRMVASTLYLPTHFGVSPGYAEAIASRLAGEIQAR